jgi:lipopolysaccharide assembly outer membrane protein LptD (OstA)
VFQTLTPRLAYNYTPYKNQNALPDFDSEKMSNTYENLFSGKKYKQEVVITPPSPLNTSVKSMRKSNKIPILLG